MRRLIYAKKRLAPMAWSPLAGGAILTSQDEKTIKLRKKLEEIAKGPLALTKSYMRGCSAI